MIRPRCARTIGPSDRRTTRYTPVRSVSITSVQASSVMRSMRASWTMPALRPPRPRCRALLRRCRSALSTCFCDRTSHWIARSPSFGGSDDVVGDAPPRGPGTTKLAGACEPDSTRSSRHEDDFLSLDVSHCGSPGARRRHCCVRSVRWDVQPCDRLTFHDPFSGMGDECDQLARRTGCVLRCCRPCPRDLRQRLDI